MLRWLLALLLAGCGTAAVPATFDVVPRDDRGVVVVFGDVRPRLAAEVWREDATRERLAVIGRIAEERPDLVVNSGDLVIDGSNAADWAQFDRETAPLRDLGIPYVAALGNHRLCGDEGMALRLFFTRFPEPEGRRWREVRVRDVALVLLDTNVLCLEPEEREEQVRWLDATLDRAEADASVGAVLLVTHHPPFTNGLLAAASAWVRDEVLGRAQTHRKVRAVFSGHFHSYERFASDGIHCVVSGGGGAPLMDIRRDGGPWRDHYDGPRRFHYCRLTLGVDSSLPIVCEVVMLGEDGAWRVADRFEIGRGPRPRRFMDGSPR